ncbi:hypothetical protein [Fulvimonas yonginensis]
MTGLIALTPEQRHQLTKMGDKSEAFCRQAGHVFGENPGVLPRNFDLEGYQRDLAALNALRPRLMRLATLHQRALDTEMAIGSDLMTNALEGYAMLKVAGKVRAWTRHARRCRPGLPARAGLRKRPSRRQHELPRGPDPRALLPKETRTSRAIGKQPRRFHRTALPWVAPQRPLLVRSARHSR